MRSEPETHMGGETALLGLVGATALVGVALWVAGQLGALATGRDWPAVPVSVAFSLVAGVARHPADPAAAWPASARAALPSPILLYGLTIAVITLPAYAVLTVVGGRRHRGRRAPDGTRWARQVDVRVLRVRRARGLPPGRLVLGRCAGSRALIAAEPRSSLLVLGPSQSGKTSALAVPAMLEWRGPIVATSVKSDLVEHTLCWRRSIGSARIYDPTGATGLPAATWTPLEGCCDWQGARRVAAWLCAAARTRSGLTPDDDFWLSSAAKLLAPELLAAHRDGRTISDVVRWVDSQEEEEVARILDGAGLEDALRAATASWERDDRTRSSIYATAEMVLDAFADPVVARSAVSCEINPAEIVRSPSSTLYLCAPSHEQERLRPVFSTLVHEVLRAAVERAATAGGSLDPPLLLVLDEAANIAPIKDLDTLASTAAGHGIQLLTVFQDVAQMQARYGERSATILNNHRAKLLLSGVSDLSTLSYVSQLVGESDHGDASVTTDHLGRRSTTRARRERRLLTDSEARRLRQHEAVLVYRNLAPVRVRLRPWFKDRTLRQRALPWDPRAPRSNGSRRRRRRGRSGAR
jgi:type IV secretion system protein VirD4